MKEDSIYRKKEKRDSAVNEGSLHLPVEGKKGLCGK